MNTWESLWPDGQIGWPGHADPAAVLLHLTPALLLIAPTETIAAYRRTITNLLDQTTPTDPTNQRSPTEPTEATDRTEPTTPAHLPTAPASRSATERADREPTTGATLPACSPPQNASGPTPPRGQTDRPGATDPAPTRPNAADDAPRIPRPEPDRPPPGIRSADADLWPHALALDQSVLAATGRPASIWRLRNELHLGPKRARRIHHQLHNHNTDRPPPHRMNPLHPLRPTTPTRHRPPDQPLPKPPPHTVPDRSTTQPPYPPGSHDPTVTRNNPME
ncbi:hypothetical protein [Streptomyces sp. cg2]|uniref:hypothetical protein n=1 Tax=Streptomyces sp. cg2 TaxID=3238799 RepID=UPI0034E23CBE